MHEFSFDIKTNKDFFNKLLEDHKELLSHNISSRAALNCAMTAWHLTDWICNEFNHILFNKYSKLFQCQARHNSRCPSLQIMHDLTNGSKKFITACKVKDGILEFKRR
jgi:hypothetical protein